MAGSQLTPLSSTAEDYTDTNDHGSSAPLRELETDFSSATKRTDLQQWAIDNWVWEFGSWIASALLLGGIALTLSIHNNQPLPEWPFGITINALISLLSTFSTSALMLVLTSVIGQGNWISCSRNDHRLSDFQPYDEASRGPWGSLMFLFTIKWYVQHVDIDTGAKLMKLRNVTSFGAIIVICSLATGPFVQQLAVVQSAPVAMDAASLYARTDYPNPELSRRTISSPLVYYNLPDIVTAGFYRGLYFSGNLSDPVSRNSFQQRPSCSTGNCTFDEFDTLAICNACANVTGHLTKSTNSSGTFWALPNGFIIEENEDTVASTGGSYDPLILQAGLPIVNITAIQPCTEENEGCIPSAQECMLYWCVNRYSANVSQGIYHEQVLDTVKYGYTINADDLENDTYVFRNNYSSQAIAAQQGGNYANLTVGKWGSSAFTDLIAEYLTLEVLDYEGYDATLTEMSNFPGTPLDMAPFFEAMALSLSSAVVSDKFNAAGLKAVTSQATSEVPFIRVRWAWIILPVGLELAVFVLLCSTVAITKREGLPIWKNSILAAVFFGARVRELTGAAKLYQYVDIKRVADRIKVSSEQFFSASA